MFARYATSLTFRVHASCSSPSTEIRAILISRNYITNTVVYTGTHDNPTTRAWFEDLPDEQRRHLWKYLKKSGGEGRDTASHLIELTWSSAAAVAMAPL